MTDIVQFTHGTGNVLIEVDSARTTGLKNISIGKEKVKEAQESFEDALEPIQGLVERFQEKLNNVKKKPKEVSVEFSIKLSASAGVIVASGTGEANFKVTMKWEN